MRHSDSYAVTGGNRSRSSGVSMSLLKQEDDFTTKHGQDREHLQRPQ